MRRLTVEASTGSRVAIEQFDASALRPLVAFGDGWHEQEFNPRTGVRWRWLSERGELRGRIPFKRLIRIESNTAAATLHLEGESPLTYFGHGSKLTVRMGGRTLLTRILNDDFSVDVPIDGFRSTASRSCSRPIRCSRRRTGAGGRPTGATSVCGFSRRKLRPAKPPAS